MVIVKHGPAQFVAVSVEIVGAALILTALLWGGLVYYQVFLNTGFPLVRAAPCLLSTSDTCSLAMSLCGGKHLFGLKRYSAELLWTGVATSVAAYFFRAVIARTAR